MASDADRARADAFKPFEIIDMLHSAELEHMTHIMASCIDILRQLAAASRDEEARHRIDEVADMVDAAAERLTDLVEVPVRQ